MSELERLSADYHEPSQAELDNFFTRVLSHFRGSQLEILTIARQNQSPWLIQLLKDNYGHSVTGSFDKAIEVIRSQIISELRQELNRFVDFRPIKEGKKPKLQTLVKQLGTAAEDSPALRLAEDLCLYNLRNIDMETTTRLNFSRRLNNLLK